MIDKGFVWRQTGFQRRSKALREGFQHHIGQSMGLCRQGPGGRRGMLRHLAAIQRRKRHDVVFDGKRHHG
jgi:hypothetical protein